MKAQALDHKSKSMALGGKAGHAAVGAGDADTTKASNVKAGIKSQADVLKQVCVVVCGMLALHVLRQYLHVLDRRLPASDCFS